MRFNSKPTLMALVAGAWLVSATTDAQVRRVDGCHFQTICVRLTPAAGPPGPLTPNCGALPILEDGWTEDLTCLGPMNDQLESETYQFGFFGPIARQIVFVEKVKIPASTMAIPFVIVEDVLIIPCNPRCSANPAGEDFRLNHRPPIFFIDDVTFPPIFADPTGGPTEWLCAFILPAEDLISFFGNQFPMELDWLACADMDSMGLFYGQPPTPDTDGNGCPDSCLELAAPGHFVQHVGIDEKGSSLVDFLLNNRFHSLTTVDVFEPQTNGFIPPMLPGMKGGESHNTRPWCFTIFAGP
ncbi:MAG: hypothetical protein HYR85_03365 [Planctomycetes bacterium]|nr:hypothetical protein [Planctomycetota bacterium]MBI3846983.1 hypothetical protein [Planctomycetota bacterium]